MPLKLLIGPIAAATIVTAFWFAAMWRGHQHQQRDGKMPLRFNLGLAAILSFGSATTVYAQAATLGDDTDQFWSRENRVNPNGPNTVRRAPIGAQKAPTVLNPPAGGSARAPAQDRRVIAEASLDIPDHDVDRACATTIMDPPTRADCIRREQSAFDSLSFIWDRLTPDHKRAALSKFAKQESPSSTTSYVYYRVLVQFAQVEAEFQQQEEDRVVTPRFQRR